jgi:VWFA-related protein
MVNRASVAGRLLVGGLAWIAAGACAHGQTSDAPVIRVDVRQVLVPVIVTDSKGHHVTGLKASDFHILEDGVPQEIAAFSTDASASASAEIAAVPRVSKQPPAPALEAGSAGHTFVICIDALHTAAANSSRTREALTRLFEKEKPDGAQYALLSIGPQLRVVQTATSDPATILSTLRKPAVLPALGGGNAAELGSEINELKKRSNWRAVRAAYISMTATTC